MAIKQTWLERGRERCAVAETVRADRGQRGQALASDQVQMSGLQCAAERPADVELPVR